MNQTNLLGYVVILSNVCDDNCDSGEDGPTYIEFVNGRNVIAYSRPTPIPVADAYRRLAGFLDTHPNVDPSDLAVEPVYEWVKSEPVLPPPSPITNCAKELASRLRALTGAHGLDLGLTDEEMESQIEKELVQFGALAKQVRGFLG